MLQTIRKANGRHPIGGYNIKKLYLVLNHTDVDGGFGDAIETAAPVVAFSNEKDAKEYVLRNNNPHVYQQEIDDLYTSQFTYVEIPYNDLNASNDGVDWELSDEYYLKRDEK